MKILALFLSGFFLFFAGVPAWAQDCKPRLFLDIPGMVDVPTAIAELAKGQDCLNQELQRLRANNGFLETEIYNLQEERDRLNTQLQNLETEIQDVDGRLNRTKLNLAITMGTIFTLEHGRVPWNPSYAAPPAGRPASKPKAPVNKPKPAVDSPKDR